MKIKVFVQQGGRRRLLGEVPALPGCPSEGNSLEELLLNLREAIEGWLSVDIQAKPGDTVTSA